MALTRLMFAPHHGFELFYHYKHVQCHGNLFKIPRKYSENFEIALQKSQLEIKAKHLREIDLEEQSGYKIPTSHGSFIITSANESCGYGYIVRNIINRESANKFTSEGFINKYFEDTIKCLQICFNPSDGYIE
ncbi:hypothetical protein NOVO_06595 [Rickettsiales bacterium Ac37b]|nr:hypothetical protein NOVO_06595 [Rickettsiales bacterium Ac37b]